MSKVIEPVKVHGQLTAILQKGDGSIETRVKDNLIVNGGFDFIANSIGKATGRPAVISHIAVGTGSAVAAGAQTALVTEIERLAGTYSHTAGTLSFQIEATFDAGVGTGAIVESGVFNDAVAGIMLDRVVFPVINKDADDTLTMRFTFTMS